MDRARGFRAYGDSHGTAPSNEDLLRVGSNACMQVLCFEVQDEVFRVLGYRLQSVVYKVR